MPNTRGKLIELLDEIDVYDTRFCNAYIADRLIAHGVTVQEWISVKDRLPPPYTPVLTYRQSFCKNPPCIKVDQMTLLYGDDKVWADDLGTWKSFVTHWMPLPQPPKGE